MRTTAALVATLLLTAIAIAETPAFLEQKQGRIVVPRGVDATTLRILVHREAPSSAESDPLPEALRGIINNNGEFPVLAIPDDAKVLEIVGPGVRRTRFPYDAELFLSPEERPIFRVEEGRSTTVRFTSAVDDLPILIGPIIPAENAPRTVVNRSFGFFESTTSNTDFAIDGLADGVDYLANIVAQGHRRAVIRFTAGAEEVLTIPLITGGAEITGPVRGAKSTNPYPETLLRLTGGPSSLHVYTRTDGDGRYRIGGLADGAYSIVPVLETAGDLKPIEFIIANQRSRQNFAIPVFEGIRIEGLVVDADSFLPLEGALIQFREASARTDQEGRFVFNDVMGPWPLRFLIEKEGFRYDPDIQSELVRELNGYHEDDLEGLVIELSRERFLEVTTGGLESQAFLDLYGPLNIPDVAFQRKALTTSPATLPVGRAGTYLARVFDTERSSRFETIHVAADQRLTPANFTLNSGAQIAIALQSLDGEPLEPLKLELVSWFGQSEIIWRQETLQDGRATLLPLPPGPVRVLVYTEQGIPILQRDVELAAGQQLTITETIERGGTFRAIAMTGEGVGVSGLTFTAYGYSPDGQPVNVQATTDREGRFRIPGLSGGMLEELRLNHQEFLPVTLSMVPITSEEFRVDLHPRPMIRATLEAMRPGSREAELIILSGQDRTEGSIINQTYFTAIGREVLFEPGTRTFRPTLAGTLQLAARDGNTWAVTPPFDWQSHEEMDFSLTPANSASLSLRFDGEIDPDSLDVTVVNTSLPEDSPEALPSPTSYARGRIDFRGIAPGMYLVVVSNQEGRSFRQTNLFLTQNREQSLRLSFDQSLVTVEGIVVDVADGRPVSGATVTIYPDIPAPEPIDQTTSGSDGRFRFTYVQGNQPLLLDAIQGERRTMQSVTPGEETLRAELRLPTLTPVRVTLGGTLEVDRQAGRSLPPLVLQGGSTRTLSLRGTNGPLETTLTPGSYRIFLGEELVGAVEVPPQRERFEVLIDPSL